MAHPDWPIPKFHFSVDLGLGEDIGFQEVSGLKLSTEYIEYRAGNDETFVKQRVPGLKKYENITLKKGMFHGQDDLYQWYQEVQTDSERRHDIVISLLDEEHNPVFTWTILKAFPISIAFPDMNAESNELAIESLELAHEGIEMEAN